MTTPNRTSQQGFALFIIAGLFMAFALIASVMIDRTNATQEVNRQAAGRDQVSRIASALVRYEEEHNNVYPCPADPALAYTDSNFGTSIASCSSSVSGGVTALYNAKMIRGMVPVRTLLIYGVTQADAFDPWGNRVMYLVDRQMTSGGGGASTAANRMAITDAVTGVSFKDPDFVVISYGRDGLGGIGKNQTTATVACTGSDPRVINCGAFSANLTMTYRPVFVAPSATSTTYYDDIMAFYNR